MIYTCDKDNDCLPARKGVKPHPFKTSTAMLAKLERQGVKSDLFFFDGRIQPQDVAMILRMSKPGTVYAFDDFRPNDKGEANVRMLWPFLPRRRLIDSTTVFNGRSAIAVLVPQ